MRRRSTVEPGVLSDATRELWHNLAQQLRADSIRSTTAAGSGHPSSSMSAADLMAALLAGHLRYDFAHPDNPSNDHLVFSKGHAAPLLYALYKAAGAISDAELMSLRKLGSRLEGHPVPTLPWVDVATGSLGQGLPIGVGIALAGRYLDRLPYRVWVLLGDAEMAEGSVWEAIDKAAHYRLGNLIAVVDVNRLGQSAPTELEWNLDAYVERARGFGWHAIAVDGHDLDQIHAAYTEAAGQTERPTLIAARTVKGKGFSAIENRLGMHGRALTAEEASRAIAELGGERGLVVDVRPPDAARPAPLPPPRPIELPRYERGSSASTRRAFGDALRALGAARPDVVALDGDVQNSTYTETFAQAFPDRFFQMFIAEQQMIAAAIGLDVRHYVPFAATFAAFLTRAADFIRMAAVSRANLRLCGSHAGVSIGEDGPSQMGLEDLALFRAVHGSTVLYPCDANQTTHLVAAMADRAGIVYLRSTRERTPVIYGPEERFAVGGSRVLRQSEDDRATVVAAGIAVHEVLAAAEQLRAEGIGVRVVDAYSVKPIDAATLRAAVQATGGRLVTVEDHYPEGGLGDAALAALAEGGPVRLSYRKLAVAGMPCSGKPAELLRWAGIDAAHIVEAVKGLLD
ncbi:MAG: transketolase [Chloroflexi bacterium]|nr:transketolase [Chloroflexota bacterium]